MLKKFADTFWDHVRPRSFYSWQSAFGLSLLAWLLSMITQGAVHFILLNLGWMLLIAAMGWFTSVNPVRVLGVSLGPWLTGLLVCLYLLVLSGGGNPGIFRVAFMSWPLISMAIAAFPDFVTVDRGFNLPNKIQTRQWLVVLLLANMLLTCWIFLGFRIQDWTKIYPGVLGETFAQSQVVIRPARNPLLELPLIRLRQPFGIDRLVKVLPSPVKPGDEEQAYTALINVVPRPAKSLQDYSRGVDILNEMVREVRDQAEGETLSNIERWLFNIQKTPPMFRDAVMQRVSRQDNGQPLDQRYWQVELSIGEPEYKLTLGSRWDGPRDRTPLAVVGPTGEPQPVERWLRSFSNPKGYVVEVEENKVKRQECRDLRADRQWGRLNLGKGYVVQQVCQITLGDNKRGIVTCDPKSLAVLRQPTLLQPCDLKEKPRG